VLVDVQLVKGRRALAATLQFPADASPIILKQRKETNLMRYLALVLAVVGAATAAGAQDAIPDIKGTWSGKGKVAVFGNNVHNPGTQTTANSPRLRDIEMTDVVEGQEGRLAWGRSSSAVMETKEPFAWAISSDNKSIVGADTDGYFHITLLGPDRMEKCYVHSGTSPSKSVVAACYAMERVKK
jgi:hypothetical protein